MKYPLVLVGWLVLAFLLPTLALADGARQLRLEAGALIQAAEAADTERMHKKLLEQARNKLRELRERYPSESTRLTLYIGGDRVTLTLEDLELRIADDRRRTANDECLSSPTVNCLLALALRTAMAINFAPERVAALRFIATAQAEAGYHGESTATFAEALLTAAAIEEPQIRAVSLSHIAGQG